MEARTNRVAATRSKIDELLKFSQVFQKVFGLKERRGVVWYLVNDLIARVGDVITFKDVCDLFLDSP
jgi:hypothetical protein